MVFLDLDGVCCDFLGGMCKLYDRNINDLPVGVYNLPELFGKSFEEIDADISTNYDFWYKLEPYPHTEAMVELLREYGRMRILSTAWPQSPISHQAKLDWCNHKIGVPTSEVILTPYKHLLSARGRLLIDDRIDTCMAWMAFGGQAIVFPTHHNKNIVNSFGGSPFNHLIASLSIITQIEEQRKTRERTIDRN